MQIGRADGVLVTGDIAFSGHSAEYDKAQVWLDRLTQTIGCDSERVWTVPGNHDVDRSVLSAYPTIRERHDRVRRCDVAGIPAELRVGLTSDTPTVLAPLENYVAFASAYSCEITPQQPFWRVEMPLGSGRALILCGLTSPLISGASDDNNANRLALGKFQALIPYRPSDVVVTLCHHPTDWLRDYEEVATYLDARARLQLFGHKHDLRMQRVDDSVKVHAGALHPERGPGWDPHYNIISIEPSQIGATITIYPRKWYRETCAFGADYAPSGEQWRRYELPLAPVSAAPALPPAHLEAAGLLPQDVEATQPLVESPVRVLANGLGRLSYLTLLALGSRLGLTGADDRRLRSVELLNLLIRRADEAGQLGVLWDETSCHVEGMALKANPYRGGKDR